MGCHVCHVIKCIRIEFGHGSCPFRVFLGGMVPVHYTSQAVLSQRCDDESREVDPVDANVTHFLPEQFIPSQWIT